MLPERRESTFKGWNPYLSNAGDDQSHNVEQMVLRREKEQGREAGMSSSGQHWRDDFWCE